MPLAKAFRKQYQVERYVKHNCYSGQVFTIKQLQSEIYANMGKEYSASTIRAALASIRANGRYVEREGRVQWRRTDRDK